MFLFCTIIRINLQLMETHFTFIHIPRQPCAVISSRLWSIESTLMESKTYLRSSFYAGMAVGYALHHSAGASLTVSKSRKKMQARS